MNSPYLASSVRALLGSGSRRLEQAAVALAAAVIVLNVWGAASRGKPAADEADAPVRAVPVGAVKAAAGARSSQTQDRLAVRKRAAVTPAAPPPIVYVFQPQKVILDATGAPARDPHRGVPLPLKLDIVARVEDVAAVDPAAAAGQAGAVSEAAPAPVKEDEAKRPATERSMLDAARPRAGKRPVAAAEPANARARAAQRLASASADRAVEASARAVRIKLASRGAVADPTPGELVLRTLRGPA